MTQVFELEWLGGAAERRFHALRPGSDDLPWGTLDAGDFAPALVERARHSWTEGALNEYATAACFAALLRALLEARAPVDLVGMAGAFVADEMLHVELNARMAMALGGAAPLAVDFAALVPEVPAGTSPLGHAAELLVRVCCVGETLSVPLLSAAMRAATHPLVRAVLERLVRDEVAHARLGWLFLEWAGPALDAAARRRLGVVAAGAIDEQRQTWPRDGDGASTAPLCCDAGELHALGWLTPAEFRGVAGAALRHDVIAPLARFGIVTAADAPA